MKLWNSEDGELISTYDGHKETVQIVTISNDEKYIVSGGGDKLIILWDMITKQPIRTFVGHSSVVSSVVLTDDGEKILSSSWDGEIKLWDISNGSILKTVTHGNRVYIFI